jgi:cyclohexa-1,5-dienecarbonyl-CoA hydratase
MAVASELSRIAVEIAAPVCQIVLRHPPLNVIDLQMMGELSQALAEAEAMHDVFVITISGDAQTFSAGVDVAAHTPDKVEDMMARFHAVIRALVASKKITIAAVRGHCLGGGAELALVCDMVFTTDSAQWGFPEIRLGCYPPVACAALAALIGQKRAAELILTGRSIKGSEAAEIGLANRALPVGELGDAVKDFLDHLSELSPSALAVAKKAFYAWDSMHFDKGLARAERIYTDDLMKTHDAQEGIRAFMEKRSPKWTGK